MAYNAIDIAKKIVCRTDVEHGDAVTNLKLQIDHEEPVDGRVVLTDAMRESLAKAQESLAEGRCLTEDMFQTHFAKWSEERQSLPNQDLIPEELLGAVWQEIDQVYQQKDLADDGEAIDLETFRADLHRMIEEVYARP